MALCQEPNEDDNQIEVYIHGYRAFVDDPKWEEVTTLMNNPRMLCKRRFEAVNLLRHTEGIEHPRLMIATESFMRFLQELAKPQESEVPCGGGYGRP